MKHGIILASQSSIRRQLLLNANIDFQTITSNIDEAIVRQECKTKDISIYKISEILADNKARKVSFDNRESIVIGCDQTLIFKNEILSKQKTKKEVLERLLLLNGKKHTLLTSAVIYLRCKVVWKLTTKATLEMHFNEKKYISDYVERHYNQIVNSPGCYMIEGEGVRLFKRIEGNYFSILGMPLIEIISFLYLNGELN